MRIGRGSGRRVSPVGRPVYGGRPSPPPRTRPDIKGQLSGGRLRRIVALIVVVGIVAWLWRAFLVERVEVLGVRGAEQARVNSETHRLLNTPLKRNLLTLNTEDVAKQLLQQSSRLKTATVVRRWPHGLSVMVTERQPGIIWKSGNQAYVVDADGTIMGEAGDFGTLRLPTVVDSTNLPVKVGDRVVPARFINFCRDVTASISRNTKLQLTGLQVPDTTSEVYAQTNKGYVIKFDTTRPAAEQVGDLTNVLAVLTKQSQTPGEYIDLRIARKAYWR